MALNISKLFRGRGGNTDNLALSGDVDPSTARLTADAKVGDVAMLNNKYPENLSVRDEPGQGSSLVADNDEASDLEESTEVGVAESLSGGHPADPPQTGSETANESAIAFKEAWAEVRDASVDGKFGPETEAMSMRSSERSGAAEGRTGIHDIHMNQGNGIVTDNKDPDGFNMEADGKFGPGTEAARVLPDQGSGTFEQVVVDNYPIESILPHIEQPAGVSEDMAGFVSNVPGRRAPAPGIEVDDGDLDTADEEPLFGDALAARRGGDVQFEDIHVGLKSTAGLAPEETAEVTTARELALDDYVRGEQPLGFDVGYGHGRGPAESAMSAELMFDNVRAEQPPGFDRGYISPSAAVGEVPDGEHGEVLGIGTKYTMGTAAFEAGGGELMTETAAVRSLDSGDHSTASELTGQQGQDWFGAGARPSPIVLEDHLDMIDADADADVADHPLRDDLAFRTAGPDHGESAQGILPYVEQDNVIDTWEHAGGSGALMKAGGDNITLENYVTGPGAGELVPGRLEFRVVEREQLAAMGAGANERSIGPRDPDGIFTNDTIQKMEFASGEAPGGGRGPSNLIDTSTGEIVWADEATRGVVTEQDIWATDRLRDRGAGEGQDGGETSGLVSNEQLPDGYQVGASPAMSDTQAMSPELMFDSARVSGGRVDLGSFERGAGPDVSESQEANLDVYGGNSGSPAVEFESQTRPHADGFLPEVEDEVLVAFNSEGEANAMQDVFVTEFVRGEHPLPDGTNVNVGGFGGGGDDDAIGPANIVFDHSTDRINDQTPADWNERSRHGLDGDGVTLPDKVDVTSSVTEYGVTDVIDRARGFREDENADGDLADPGETSRRAFGLNDGFSELDASKNEVAIESIEIAREGLSFRETGARAISLDTWEHGVHDGPTTLLETTGGDASEDEQMSLNFEELTGHGADHGADGPEFDSFDDDLDVPD